jgi:hypothetical protein
MLALGAGADVGAAATEPVPTAACIAAAVALTGDWVAPIVVEGTPAAREIAAVNSPKNRTITSTAVAVQGVLRVLKRPCVTRFGTNYLYKAANCAVALTPLSSSVLVSCKRNLLTGGSTFARQRSGVSFSI